MRGGLFAGTAVALALLAPLAPAQEAPSPPSDTETLDPLRDRFHEGMERYNAGDYAQAILVWTEIYRELGPEKGYRLAFNLGRAYDLNQNEPKALEYYEAYLAGVAKRRAEGETLEALVEKQEAEANERLAAPREKYGRLHIVAPGMTVRVDTAPLHDGGYVAYVTPGTHTVKFRPGTTDEAHVDVSVDAGQVVEVNPPPPKAVPAPIPTTAPPPAPPPVPSPRYENYEQRPYPRGVLVVGATLTTLSFIVPLVLYVRAGDKFDAANGSGAHALHDDYASAKTTAYASWTIPAVLGAATIGLTVYWLLNGKTVQRPLQTALAQSILRGASW